MLTRPRSLTLLGACIALAASFGAAASLAAAKAKSKGDTAADTKLFDKLLAITSPQLSVASAKNATHAKNADKLGGKAASGFQLRVTQSCTGSNAIQSIASDGTVTCQPTGTGTLTGLTAGTGLTGGGSSGNVSLALDPNYQLPQGCASNQLPKWSGTAWSCTDPPGGHPTGTAGGDLTGSYPNPSIANGAITDANVATANKDGLANVPSLRTLGTGAQQAVAGNDSRLSDARTPTGAAGGDLSGTYPNPTVNTSRLPFPGSIQTFSGSGGGFIDTGSHDVFLSPETSAVTVAAGDRITGVASLVVSASTAESHRIAFCANNGSSPNPQHFGFQTMSVPVGTSASVVSVTGSYVVQSGDVLANGQGAPIAWQIGVCDTATTAASAQTASSTGWVEITH